MFAGLQGDGEDSGEAVDGWDEASVEGNSGDNTGEEFQQVAWVMESGIGYACEGAGRVRDGRYMCWPLCNVMIDDK
jgi:hypothetical protein